MNDKVLSMLSLCRKAGKLVAGFDPVAESIRSKKAHLVLLASDLSPKTRSEVAYTVNKGGSLLKIMELPHTMDQLSMVLGRRSGVLAVADQGLADAVRRAADMTNREE